MFAIESRFLVVDDSASVRALVKEQLASLGFSNVVEANNGKEAVKKLEGLTNAGVKIDLIIADWVMPEMTGIDLLRDLKENQLYKQIPFLMITTEGHSERVVEAIVSGVNDFIIKPFDEKVLSERLTSIWKRLGSLKS